MKDLRSIKYMLSPIIIINCSCSKHLNLVTIIIIVNIEILSTVKENIL